MNKQNKPVFPQDENRLSQKMTLFSSMLKEGYHLRMRVTGTSMSPFLKTGAIVTLSKIPVDQLKIGDIIFCQRDERTLKLHRLIAIKKNMLITKGDALDSSDHPVDETGYLGKVTCIEDHCSYTVWPRNMETPLSHVINYSLAIYFRYRSFLICTAINLKSYLNINRLNIPESR